MSGSERDVRVLGLGRMGTAMATSLQEHGWHVTAWNRSPRDTGLPLAADAGAAVAGARLVLLCLFDGDACREVLHSCLGHLEPGALVVNTSTVGPEEATALARLVADAGARYVHAPVMGSLPAIRAGRLVVLAGGSPSDVSEARGLLDVLAAEVRQVGDPARAASLKLVANASLAGALIALHDTLEAAAALGLDVDETLDVLAKGQLGGLSEAKRDRLTGVRSDAPADFTIGALQKDLGLLSGASGSRMHAERVLTRLIGDGRVGLSDDVAAACVPASITQGAA